MLRIKQRREKVAIKNDGYSLTGLYLETLDYLRRKCTHHPVTLEDAILGIKHSQEKAVTRTKYHQTFPIVFSLQI